MKQYLPKLFTELKRGDQNGIEISEIIHGLTIPEIDELKKAAIDDGFAEQTKHNQWGESWALKLTPTAKQYDTYQEFKDRHKRPPSIIDSFNNNSDSTIITHSLVRDSEFHHKEKIYPKIPDKESSHTGTSTTSNILNKIYNWTNHQVIGGLIVGLILLGLTIYFTTK